MKVWITKYALSDGCCIANGDISSSGVRVSVKWGAGRVYAKLGTEAVESEAEAIEIVRRMIEKKRASLTKQLARLDTLDAETIVKNAKDYTKESA